MTIKGEVVGNKSEIPTLDTVVFQSNGIQCVAFVAFGERGLNMHSCQINLGKKPKVNIEYLPTCTRIMINDGAVWFDVEGQDAVDIESLFITGQSPRK